MLKQASLIAVLLLAAGCQSNPKQTVLNLDTTDRKWSSRECIRHRKAAADYNDGERTRALVGFADYAVPFVGTATSMLLSWRKDPARAELNERIAAACVSPSRRAAATTPRPYPYKPYREARGGGGGRYGE